jgi:hypothetical protein
VRGIRAVCAISAVALAACSSPAQPETLPAVTTEPTPVEGPTPSLSVESPPAVTDQAIDFVDEYFASLEGSIRSEEALANRRASFAPSCTLCAAGADVAEEILSTGYQVSGGLVEHKTVEVQDSADGALVQVRYRISEIELTDSSGTVVGTAPTTDWRTQVLEIRQQPDGSWLIISAEQLP